MADLVRPPGIDGAGRAPGRWWTVVNALLLSWLMPATAARNLLGVGLLEAFVFHVGCGGFLFFAGTAAATRIIGRPVFPLYGMLLDEITRHPIRWLAASAIFVACLEAAWFCLALLLVPWAARDGRPRASLRYATRTAWLQSFHVVLACLPWLCSVAIWDRWRGSMLWRVSRWSELPWYLRYEESVFTATGTLFYAWALWGLPRAAGARTVCRPEGLEPRCQTCGYNLTAASVDSACPECGEPVRDAIGPQARPARTGSSSTSSSSSGCSVRRAMPRGDACLAGVRAGNGSQGPTRRPAMKTSVIWSGRSVYSSALIC